MKHSFFFSLVLLNLFIISLNSHATVKPKTKISVEEMHDKIKGGWVGQVIGCTFGGPTEARYNGTMIQDYQPIPWDNSRCSWFFENFPGLYDDIYMDMTFVDVIEKEGIDASAESHAKAFAYADYELWHANQAARYNILAGIMPPKSGFWLSNPHSDDIDFQIEADFAGLMSPGMPNTANEICDKIGHIMNYGDGWYGGVYVASMYSLAFIYDDINTIVTEGLKAIPVQSEFYKCISDVIRWKKEFPKDWKSNWFECQKKWSSDIGCSEGVFNPWDIDAKLNAAYVVIGLLYGEENYGKTIEISTRCGEDSDCNPATAAGILGTMLGYKNIPEYWKSPIYPIEDVDFKYTTMSLNDVYRIGTKHATEILKKNGAIFKDNSIEIPVQTIKPVKFEAGFIGNYPIEKREFGKSLVNQQTEIEFDFEGNGFILAGAARKSTDQTKEDYIFKLELSIDGKVTEQFEMSTSFITRKYDIAWNYQLAQGKHQVKVRVLNPKEGYSLYVSHLIVYSSEKVANAMNTK